MKRALITGITGQDGSYLAELLLVKGYEVHGIVRRNSAVGKTRISHLEKRLNLHDGDMLDGVGLARIVREVQPDEVYNLAAQSHVGLSFQNPCYTADVTGTGAVRLFEAVLRFCPTAKVYQAGSSEMFGYGGSTGPIDEHTRFHPRSVYACSKVFAHYAAVNYREAHRLFICNGMLFNHESPRRGPDFVTRKITIAIGEILRGERKTLELGNLDAMRDWGYAPEYVQAMWLMLQQRAADDYVVGTGETHSVRDFVESAFRYAELNPLLYVQVSQDMKRPADVNYLVSLPSKAKKVLGWEANTRFNELVKIMVEADK